VQEIVYERLLPGPGSATAAEFITGSRAPAGSERPRVVATFVVSVDGRTAVDGRSRELSDDGDRELHRTLREHADAVLAGTGTIAAEDYMRMLPAQQRRERRLAAGRSAEPLAVTVSRSGALPLQTRLFADPEAHVVVFTPAAPDLPGVAASVTWEALRTDLAGVLRTLRQNHGVQTLLCEGGPTLLGALLSENLVDELFLTIAPVLVGGDCGPAVVSGPPLEAPLGLTLTGALQRGGSLFLRYALR